MNERMSNKRVADLIDLVTADVDYVEDPDELVAALHDLLDARAEIVVATKELTRLSVEIVRAERERDEARKALDSIWEVVRTGVYGPPYDFHLGQLASIRGFIDIERAARVAGGGEDE